MRSPEPVPLDATGRIRPRRRWETTVPHSALRLYPIPGMVRINVPELSSSF